METIKAWLKNLISFILGDDSPNTAQAPTPEPIHEPTPTPAPAPAPTSVERHKVAGISYRTQALMTLGIKNEDYDLTKKQLVEEWLIGERVYRTDFYASRCELIPEPENPEDPKAIKVVVDGAHIGYIKKGSCARIHKLLREDRIESVSCEIGGGAYKVVLTECDYDEDGNEIYTLEKDIIPYYAVVTIKVRDKTPAS